jgi:hypothetical protein
MEVEVAGCSACSTAATSLAPALLEKQHSSSAACCSPSAAAAAAAVVDVEELLLPPAAVVAAAAKPASSSSKQWSRTLRAAAVWGRAQAIASTDFLPGSAAISIGSGSLASTSSKQKRAPINRLRDEREQRALVCWTWGGHALGSNGPAILWRALVQQLREACWLQTVALWRAKVAEEERNGSGKPSKPPATAVCEQMHGEVHNARSPSR